MLNHRCTNRQSFCEVAITSAVFVEQHWNRLTLILQANTLCASIFKQSVRLYPSWTLGREHDFNCATLRCWGPNEVLMCWGPSGAPPYYFWTHSSLANFPPNLRPVVLEKRKKRKSPKVVVTESISSDRISSWWEWMLNAQPFNNIVVLNITKQTQTAC